MNCDLLLTADLIATQDKKRRVLEHGALAIDQGRILAVGPADSLKGEYRAAQTLEMGPRLVLPGLVNAHTHASMSIFRGIADDLPLNEWLNDHIWPVEKDLTHEVVRLGALLSCAEMIRTGTTCFSDMYLLEDEVARAVDDAGIRAELSEGIFNPPALAFATEDECFEVQQAFFDKYKDHSRIKTVIMPHAVYTTTPALLERSRDAALQMGVKIKMHLAETGFETQACLEAFGKRPVDYLDSLGLLHEDLVVFHGVVLEEPEIARLAENGCRVVHCPQSNLKLASGIAPMEKLASAGVDLALGTDGAASNNNLNMFEEMNTAALLQKGLHGDPTIMDAQFVLDMATLGGARSMDWPELGSLAPGQAADLVALDLDEPGLVPLYNPVSHLVYAATGLETCLTMVEGKILYQEGRFTTIDMHALRREIAAIKKWILQRTG